MKRIVVNLLRVLVAGVAVQLQLSPAFAQGISYTLLTITNPAPAPSGFFGISVAAVGNDRVLVGAGASDARAAYLLSTNGTLLTTFTNPTPASSDYFGISVAAVSTDRVLIAASQDDTGASAAGVVYLFSTSGNLLTTFTNPTPAVNDQFGSSVAAVGSDRVLIGADQGDVGAIDAGVAYLFSTNGTLLTTFTNPAPATGDEFGSSVAALGNDRVLIGAFRDDFYLSNIGTAYLFNTNGTLLTTFTNPTPAVGDEFGYSLAAVGNDRVLIGAYRDNTGATFAGAAYLFSTNGTLLTTFTNPTPAATDVFGISVAAVGGDRVLIGAYLDDTGATNSGVAYLFSTAGTLLVTVTNPTPEVNDRFGYPVAAMGKDQLIIGAFQDNTGASDAGATYLFTLVDSLPSLSIRLLTSTTVVSWPSPSTGWTLQENTNGVTSVNWSNAPGPIQDDGTNKTLIVNPPAGSRFYRLFKP